MFIRLSKEDRKKIKELKQCRNYDDIYRMYGQKVYLKNVSRKYKREDRNKLYAEGKFWELQEKYGKNYFNFNMGNIIAEDIYQNTGDDLKAVNTRWFYNALYQAKFCLKYVAIILLTSTIVITLESRKLVNEEEKKNEIVYEKEIDAYNEMVENYANNLDIKNKDDLEIIMGVVADMWDSVVGYRSPEIDAMGYYRLDVQNGFSVCRGMADDITAKLNAINPDYNARNLVVNFQSKKWVPADIERLILDNGSSNSSETEDGVYTNSFLDKFMGNHMITLVDLKKDNITLAIDSTNAGIGVLKNGKLVMFNNLEGDYEIKAYHNFLISGFDDYLELLKTQAASVFNFESVDTLREEYGIEAQNKALTKK